MALNVSIDLSKLPIIGGLISKIDNTQRQVVQSVTEQVAAFKLVPQRLRNATQRISRLLLASQQGTDAIQLSSAAQGLAAQYDRVNASVDASLQLISSKTFNVESLSLIGSAALGIRSTLGGIASLEGQIAQQERSLNLPPQLPAQAIGNSLWIVLAVGVLGAAAISYARPRR